MNSINEQTRIDWVEEELKKLLSSSSLLDAGAGEQQYRRFCGHLKYTSQDFAAYDPKGKDTGLQMNSWDYGKLDIVSDITTIPLADATYDAILCTEVFEHIPDPLKALSEFSRILKPGGKLILTAPFCSMTHFAPYHFSTGFSRFYYEHHLPLLGFKIERLTPNGNYFSSIMQEVGRSRHIAINYNLPEPSRIESWALKIVQKMFQNYAAIDNQSSELMCFGWHVIAIKN